MTPNAQCARCGRKPALGWASASVGDKEARYCHPDFADEGPDCYSLSSMEGFPELTGKVIDPLERLRRATDRYAKAEEALDAASAVIERRAELLERLGNNSDAESDQGS